MKNANNICLILDFNHQVAGKLEFRAGGQIRHQHKGWVDIAFLPAFRGKGFGSKMFEFFISWAKQNPTIEVINLQVVSDNIAAINLYKKFGFTEIGRDPYHEKVNGQYSVIITMQLFLKSAT